MTISNLLFETSNLFENFSCSLCLEILHHSNSYFNLPLNTQSTTFLYTFYVHIFVYVYISAKKNNKINNVSNSFASKCSHHLCILSICNSNSFAWTFTSSNSEMLTQITIAGSIFDFSILASKLCKLCSVFIYFYRLKNNNKKR